MRPTAVFAPILLALATAASAQTTLRDGSGRITGTVTTDSNGTKTFRDGTGRTTGTATIDANGTTTFRDATGRTTGIASSHGVDLAAQERRPGAILLSQRLERALPADRRGRERALHGDYPMNSTNMLAFAALVLASLTSSQDLKAETSCLVSDPSGTPLNVLSRPNGPTSCLVA